MPWWVPLIVAVAGATAKNRSEDQRIREQTRLTDAMTQFRSGKAAEGRAAIEDYTKTLDPAARAQALADEEALLGESLNTSVGTTKAYERPTDFSGKVSPDYARVRQAGQGRTDERLSRAITQLKTMGAPAQAALKNSFAFNTAGSAVDNTNTGANYVSKAYQDAIDRAMGNQGLRRGGELAMQAANAYGYGRSRRSTGRGFDE